MELNTLNTDLESLSVVIPVANEERNISKVVLQVSEVLSELTQIRYSEIIVVDDGSTDQTPVELEELKSKVSNLSIITFRKNYGKSAALMAGFDKAKGDIIITLDGDTQDDPCEIPRFIEKLHSGYDLVSGWKKERKDPLEKTLPSKLFNFFVGKVTKINLHDFNCGFKAYRSWCLENISLTGNLYRFLPVFIAQHGGKICEIPVKHHPRTEGKSKYGYKRYLEGTLDLCTIILISRFFQNPLYFFGLIGIPLMLLGGFIASYLVLGHLYFLITLNQSYELVARPLLQISITLFGMGLHIFLIGLLAELILSKVPSKSYDIKSIR